jgi:hypothetical protein
MMLKHFVKEHNNNIGSYLPVHQLTLSMHIHVHDASHKDCNAKILTLGYMLNTQLSVFHLLTQRMEKCFQICLLCMSVHTCLSPYVDWLVGGKFSYFGSESSSAKTPFRFRIHLHRIYI